MSCFQVDALECDALQVLNLVRSTRNAFAPVNRTPPEVLSLIPDYWEDYEKDMNLIRLTHVCRSWREIFVSRPSLWTDLDFWNTDKTRVYIERSKCVPLEIYLEPPYLEGAFLLAIPHIHRLKALWVSGGSTDVLPVLVEHFSCPLPLLDELEIDFSDGGYFPTLPHQLFNGNISSLRKLTLMGVITPLPWRDLSSLTTFKFRDVPEGGILLTQLLDFFESAPHLCYIRLYDSLPSSSNAPTERVVPLPHLKDLNIKADQPHSILLNHLSIPVGASLRLKFRFGDEHSPISSYLPESPGSLRNLSRITAVNLCFGPCQGYTRLNGPSGELYIFGDWMHEEQSDVWVFRVILFLHQFDISRTRWLTVALCGYQPLDPAQTAESIVYQTLHPMEDLRTLTLIECEDLPFIHTLNPDKNPEKIILCPRLEEIVIHTRLRSTFLSDELVDMARERALRGAKLSAIKIINTTTAKPAEEAFFPLREHVERVEYRFASRVPEWDTFPS